MSHGKEPAPMRADGASPIADDSGAGALSVLDALVALERDIESEGAPLRPGSEMSPGAPAESDIFLRPLLDALAATIAVLDASGLIVAVNAPWRHFADANGLAAPRHGVGSDYLAACDAAADAAMRQALEVIFRGALAGGDADPAAR